MRGSVLDMRVYVTGNPAGCQHLKPAFLTGRSIGQLPVAAPRSSAAALRSRRNAARLQGADHSFDVRAPHFTITSGADPACPGSDTKTVALARRPRRPDVRVHAAPLFTGKSGGERRGSVDGRACGVQPSVGIN